MDIKFGIDDVWIESLRPQTLDEVIGNKQVIDMLKIHIAKGQIQHYLFSGSPGTGKTATALCMAKAIWGTNYKAHFAEFNSSDERGLPIVRGDIKDVAMQSNSKIIFLDEADGLTAEAMDALRRTIERNTATTRFILSCNHKHKIIDPIISRMTCFHFSELTNPEMNILIDRVCVKKNLIVPQDVRDILFRYAKGDSRKIINTLQAASILSPNITKETVQVLTQTPDIETAKIILTTAISGDFVSAREMLMNQYIQKGFDAELCCDAILDAVQQIPLTEDKNKNDRMVATINAIVANHAHFMTRSNAKTEFGGILAKISLIKDIKSLDQVIL